jgi:hypothetical protein
MFPSLEERSQYVDKEACALPMNIKHPAVVPGIVLMLEN